ncbi:hypothetical protein SDC9_202173 [bioreactor metagenome]|uniref:Uncharacterized protein n=1 Tax=bioreactor metagenome TaxID=1076179 RepID=A0A645J4U7_9ZZZZ
MADAKPAKIVYHLRRFAAQLVLEADPADQLAIDRHIDHAHSFGLAFLVGRHMNALALDISGTADQTVIAVQLGRNAFAGNFLEVFRLAQFKPGLASQFDQRQGGRVVAEAFASCRVSQQHRRGEVIS